MTTLDLKQIQINSVIELFSQGKISQALEVVQDLFKDYPNEPILFNISGACYAGLGQLDAAVKSYEEAIAIKPDYAKAHFNLAGTLHDLGQLDAAIISYEKTIEIKSDFAEAHNNLGNVFKELQQDDAAIQSYKKALVINPEYVESHYSLGIIFQELGQFESAIKCYEKVLVIKPNFAEAYNNLGNAFNMLLQKDEAIKFYEKAIAIKSDYAGAYANLASVLKDLKRLEEALVIYESEIIQNSDLDFILGELLHTRMHLCIWDDLPNKLNELRKKINNSEKVLNPFLLLALIDDPELQRKQAEICAIDLSTINNKLPRVNYYANHKKIRIGYFSPDFREHPVGLLTAELYELHDRDHFEVYAFSLWAGKNDEVNLRIKAGVDNFYDVHMMSVKDIVLLSRSLEIDIAIDLGGFTAHSRLDIFAMFAAPIQINFLGYPGTMGSNYYDYIIADKSLISEDSKSNFSENIIYLPNCYMPQDRSRKVSEKPLTRQEFNLPEDGFVFCCFNNSFKITSKEFDVWMRLLSKINGSVLWLLKTNISSEINLQNEAKKRGIESERLIFADKLQIEEHLARQKLADLFLDTFTFNAHTTASDALWVGLPVLTKVGKGFAARVASSLLTALEIPELITTSENEYEALALTLATNPEKLASIKKKIVDNITLAPLYDTQTYTKDLEKAYSYAYERYSSGLQPTELKVL